MPSPAFMTIQGETQGNITAGTFTEESVGNTWREGHEDETMIQSFEHTITLPRDPQSGQPTGQRVHRPIKVVKAIDKCSPMLMRALTSGEKLPKVELKLYRPSAKSGEEHYFTLTLEDAIITNITQTMVHAQLEGSSHLVPEEEVEFTYRKIIKTHEIASTSESDDWRSAAKA